MRRLFGCYFPTVPWGGMEPVVRMEWLLGRQLDVVHFFQAWGNDWGAFRPDWLSAVARGGRRPLISWEPWRLADGSTSVEQPEYRLRRIAAGAFDGYVRAWARGLRGHGGPVYLRPMHEMNGTWYPWSGVVNGNRPEDFVRAWVHLREVFAQEGADNVRWVWCPLVDDVPTDNVFERYWPGAAHVDVLGLDGYNWGATVPEYGGWRSFDDVFAAACHRIAHLAPRLPLWLAEVGSDAFGGDKAAWVRHALRTGAPRIEAVVWFEAEKERDWRIGASDRTIAAVRSALDGQDVPDGGE